MWTVLRAVALCARALSVCGVSFFACQTVVLCGLALGTVVRACSACRVVVIVCVASACDAVSVLDTVAHNASATFSFIVISTAGASVTIHTDS